MAKILSKREFSPGVKEYTLEAPLIAKKCQAGQFVIIRTDIYGERIPLTIADFDRDGGVITIVVQEVGNSTKHLGEYYGVGDDILDLLGPLGRPSHIENFGAAVCIGGGIGVAPVYPIARELKRAGNKIISIIGARNKDLIIFEEKMRAISDELIITTDDGSFGRKGFVTDPLGEILRAGDRPGLVLAIGPVVMMRNVAAVTKEYGVYTVASLNSIMVDGTGMCGGCRVSVGDETKFVCVDGPEFDAHLVDFTNLLQRQQMYKEQELMEYSCGGHCKCL
jgi:ferredoxin--NADP+ reductase